MCFQPVSTRDIHRCLWYLIIQYMWRFPKIGVPPNHPFLDGISHYKPFFWGTPMTMEPPHVSTSWSPRTTQAPANDRGDCVCKQGTFLHWNTKDARFFGQEVLSEITELSGGFIGFIRETNICKLLFIFLAMCECHLISYMFCESMWISWL